MTRETGEFAQDIHNEFTAESQRDVDIADVEDKIEQYRGLGVSDREVRRAVIVHFARELGLTRESLLGLPPNVSADGGDTCFNTNILSQTVVRRHAVGYPVKFVRGGDDAC